MSDFKIKFRGVRGSYPVANRNVMEYGGNIKHIRLIRGLLLNQGRKGNDFIHRHAQLIGTLVELIIELIIHIPQEGGERQLQRQDGAAVSQHVQDSRARHEARRLLREQPAQHADAEETVPANSCGGHHIVLQSAGGRCFRQLGG